MKKYLLDRFEFQLFVLAIGAGIVVLAFIKTPIAPSCSDRDVKEQVQKTSEDELKSQLFKNFLSQKGIRIVTPSYEIWKNNPPQELEEIKQIIDSVDMQVDEMNFKLSAIRVNSKDNEIRKSECAANLTLYSGKKISISYTVQYTEEDNDIYVEVFGL